MLEMTLNKYSESSGLWQIAILEKLNSTYHSCAPIFSISLWVGQLMRRVKYKAITPIAVVAIVDCLNNSS